MSYDLEMLRAQEFPWATAGDAIYLNNASTGPLPTRTVAASGAFMRMRAEPFRLTDSVQFATLTRARELCARLIGASSAEIALMVNTTYGVNLAARALPLKSGDVIVTFDREFPANIYPWMALERRGIRLVRIPCRDRLPDEDALLAALDQRGVRAVSVSWVQFSSGYRADLARIGRACRERGIFFVVDAIQGLGATPIDVKSCLVDVLAAGGQKWLLSPWGTGFAYVRAELIPTIEPAAVGWMAVKASDDFSKLVDYDLTWRDDARRFEVITLPFQDFAGLNASLELMFELGPEAIAEQVAALATRIANWAQTRSDVELITPADPAHRAGIVSFIPADAPAAARRLAEAGVVFSLREGAIRLSPHCYNTNAEIDRALEVMEG